MDVLETQQISERTIEKVVVHPLVLRIIADQYKRVAKDSGKRVIGVLVGRRSSGIVDVTNCYTVPLEEDGKDPCSWSLDQEHHRYMLNVFQGINDMVGWYSTGPELRANDLDVHAQFCRYAPNPVFVIIDVQPQVLGIPTKAYYAIEDEERNQKVFVPASVEIGHEVEESGVEPLLNDLKDTPTIIAIRPLALDGVSALDATEAFMEYYKRQVRISVEGYDLSIRPVDLYISLENHFSSCGDVEFVEVPRDPMTNATSSRFATVLLRGEGAEEKALALNGSDVGGWRVSVKVLPPALSSLIPGLSTRESARLHLAHFRRYKSRGITVKGYDYSLCEADVKSALVNHFSSCGEITDVFVFKRRALVYFFGNCAVGKALKHCRSQKRVTGFRARAMPIPKRQVVAGSDAYSPYAPVTYSLRPSLS